MLTEPDGDAHPQGELLPDEPSGQQTVDGRALLGNAALPHPEASTTEADEADLKNREDKKIRCRGKKRKKKSFLC